MSTLVLAVSTLVRPVRRLDRVLLAFAAVLAALALLLPGQALDSLAFTAESLARISPFLLLSMGVAAYTKAAGVDRLLGRVFGRSGVAAMIVAAALFGALSPFCSCGVIPVIAALLAAGMPLPAVMAFWIASPIMDPEMFILTASGLGLEFAVAKTLAAIAMGLASGFATLALERSGGLADPLAKRVTCGGAAALAGADGTEWRFWRNPERRAAFAAEFRGIGLFLGKWLALAFLLESLMLAYLPAQAIGAWLGGDSALAVPAAVLAGIPAYLNGFAAIPTVAGLLELGMSPAAGLAFMTAGGVTSMPAAVAVWALVKRPVFAWYIALALAGSAATGFAYQAYLAL